MFDLTVHHELMAMTIDASEARARASAGTLMALRAGCMTLVVPTRTGKAQHDPLIGRTQSTVSASSGVGCQGFRGLDTHGSSVGAR